MKLFDRETEVCVLGGGPAGATIAYCLAHLGHAVYLVERMPFPRAHIGESLAPSILPLLERLTLRERIEQGNFLRPRRAIVRWHDATDHLKSHTGEPGFQVDRGCFDALVLEAARERGVQVLQPGRAMPPYHESPGQWRIPIDHKGNTSAIRARFLVDATGRRALLAGRRNRGTPPTLALYAYWCSTGIGGDETRVEAGPDMWFWGAPLPDGTFNATVLLDADESGISGRHDLESRYRSMLARSVLLHPCLNGLLVGSVIACSANTYQDTEPVGEDFIKVGEAAFAIDPLSSQGVQAAMRSAHQGSIVVHTLLTMPQDAAAACQFYQNRLSETVTQHTRWTARHYAEPTAFADRPFWRKRAESAESIEAKLPFLAQHPTPPQLTLQSQVHLAPSITWIEVPVIRGAVVTTARALCMPMLERPVVFVDDIEISPYALAISGTLTIQRILERWSATLPYGKAMELLYWMLGYGVLHVEER
jgi:flavin-dependent dehydrogenase